MSGRAKPNASANIPSRITEGRGGGTRQQMSPLKRPRVTGIDCSASSQVTVRDLTKTWRVRVGEFAGVEQTLGSRYGKILAIIKAILPTGHALENHQQLRNLLQTLLPPLVSIHACAHDHVLFIGEHELATECPRMGVSPPSVLLG